MGIQEFITKADIFFTPVGIRYKGGKFFKTFYGGLISLIAATSMIFFVTTSLLEFLAEDVYNESDTLD